MVCLRNKNKIKFSFIVPARNSSKTLLATLESIVALDLKDFELIVVDNKSTDETKRLASNFAPAKYLHCKEVGRSFARNYGAKAAQGDYLVFIDSDVVLDRGWVQTVYKLMEQRQLDVACSAIYPRDESHTYLDQFRLAYGNWKSRGTHISLIKQFNTYPLINSAAFMIKKSSFFAVNGFDEGLKRNEDVDLSFRLFQYGFLLGGTCNASAWVRYAVPSSIPLSRELSYIFRSFEIWYHQGRTKGERPPLRPSLFKYLNKTKQPTAVLAFAALTEMAAITGWFLSPHKPKTTEKQKNLKNLKKSVIYSFKIKNTFYFLKNDLSIIWIDEDCYLFKRLSPKKLSPQDSLLMRQLVEGELSDASRKKLFKMGVFDAIGT